MIDRVESFYYSQDEYQHIVFHSSILLEKIKSKKQVVNQFLIMLVVLFLFLHSYIVRNKNNRVVLVSDWNWDDFVSNTQHMEEKK